MEAKAVRLSENVYWVGAIDWNLRDFHGFSTSRGTTYNAYLVVDDRIALIDNVKKGFADEMFARIASVLDPARINVVVSNHTEMDHSGCLPLVLDVARDATLVTSKKAGEIAIDRHFHTAWPRMGVGDGDEISLGKRTLRFFSLAMLHWPDSMATYLPEEQILFPNDAFGQHLATSLLFDDQEDLEVIMQEARKYYATIVMPLGVVVQRALEKLRGVPIKIIAPSHGAIWRSHLDRIVEAYASWADGRVKRKAVIAYDSMWGSTTKMAQGIAEGLSSRGIEVKLYNLSCSDESDVISDLLEARALVVGSATANNGMLGPVAGFLNVVKGLRPKGKVGAAFGSYGWGGGAVRAIEQQLQEMGVELVQPGLGVQFVPNEKELASCIELGKKIAGACGGGA